VVTKVERRLWKKGYKSKSEKNADPDREKRERNRWVGLKFTGTRG
jgi:hypothetical protein